MNEEQRKRLSALRDALARDDAELRIGLASELYVQVVDLDENGEEIGRKLVPLSELGDDL